MNISNSPIISEPEAIDYSELYVYGVGFIDISGNWENINDSFSAKFNIGTTILTWKVYDKYNNESSAQVNVNVYDAFGPIF